MAAESVVRVQGVNDAFILVMSKRSVELTTIVLFEEQLGLWLRWCDNQGQIIPTGAESSDLERQRAARLAERLREMGVDPDTI